MKDFIKLAAVGLAGYFIGFYEMKYKVMKVCCEIANETEIKESTKKDQEDES